MPVYPSYDFIDVLVARRRAAPRRGRPREHSRRRTHRPPERRQVRAVQPHRRRRQRDRVAKKRERRATGTSRETDWAGRHFWLVDTGGVADDPRAADGRRDPPPGGRGDRRGGPAALRRRRASVGLHPSDHHVAEMLRNSRKPWMVVANKVDDPRATDFYEFYNARRRRSVSGLGDQRQGLRRPARRGRRATARRRRRSRRTRSASPSSASRTSASRRS